MTTNDPRPAGQPADGDRHPSQDIHPDSEPQYVEQPREYGQPMYSASTRPQGDYARPDDHRDRPQPGGRTDAGPTAGQPYSGWDRPGPAQAGQTFGMPVADASGQHGGQHPTAQHPSTMPYQPGPAYAPYTPPQGSSFGPPAYYGSSYPPPYSGWTPPPAPVQTKPSAKRRAVLTLGAAVVAAGLVLSGVAIAHTENAQQPSASVNQNPGGSTGGGSTGGGSLGGGSGSGGSSGGGAVLPGGGGSSSSGTSTSASVATKTQQVGIVTVVSVLGYSNAESAGTGMILTSSGEILTNNHVVDGATNITVTVESTGVAYRAYVVGTSPTQDVAVLQLRNASGLSTAKVGNSADVTVGDAVVGVGNAGGGGVLRASSGKVTALDQSITASDESGQNSERLHDLIQINAGIVAGDSGGPLYDSSGRIVGMDTAASTSNTSTSATAYAIPIDNALSVASKIEAGSASSVIHIGYPAFIGVAVNPSITGGAGVASVFDGTPAANAGITPGSVITSLDGTTITGSTQLHDLLGKDKPGQTVSLGWTDSSGASHTASLTLIQGPAD